MVPWGSIWALTRIERLFRSTTPPCGLTVSVHLSIADDQTAPFVIVSASGRCSRGHRPSWLALFDTSADTPAYVPSNAVGGGPGACATTGVVKAKATIVKSAFVRPDMFSSL
jgi:hypothetical protein